MVSEKSSFILIEPQIMLCQTSHKSTGKCLLYTILVSTGKVWFETESNCCFSNCVSKKPCVIWDGNSIAGC